MSPMVFGEAPRRRSRRSHLEDRLARYLAMEGLPAPVREHRFAAPRRWRFDFAWPSLWLAVELEGGVFVHGRHSRGVDMTGDCDKYNVAAVLGWRVYRFTVKHFESGVVFTVVRALLRGDRGDASGSRAVLDTLVGTAAVQERLGEADAVSAPQRRTT